MGWVEKEHARKMRFEASLGELWEALKSKLQSDLEAYRQHFGGLADLEHRPDGDDQYWIMFGDVDDPRFSGKRSIHLQFDGRGCELRATSSNPARTLTFKIVPDGNGDARFMRDGAVLSLEDVSREILKPNLSKLGK